MIKLFKNMLSALGFGVHSISDKKLIMRTFIQFCDEKTQLTIEFCDPKRSTDIYSSSVIAIHPGENRIVLDELIPHKGNVLVGKKTECMIKAAHGAKFFKFKGSLSTIEGESPPCYIMDLPCSLEESQKRQAFRISISRVQNSSVTLNIPNREPLSGRILDISATGARVELTTIVSPAFKSGDAVEKCILTLPDKGRIACKAEVRHWVINRGRKSTTVGLKFLTISAAEQKLVTRFVNEMQRKVLKITQDKNTGPKY